MEGNSAGYAQVQPRVCPTCGRCPTCGQAPTNWMPTTTTTGGSIGTTTLNPAAGAETCCRA